MKKLLTILLAFPLVATAQDVYVVNVQPRLVTVQQQQCNMQEFHREGSPA